MSPAITVVGYGPAAHRLVQRLHHHGHRGPVTVFGGEPQPAYNRAQLLSVLDGTLPSGALALGPLPPGTEVRTGSRITAVDPGRRLLRDGDGGVHPYEVLVLATGSRPVLPPLSGAGDRRLPDIRVPHTLPGAEPVDRGPVVVVGGGLRGTETAYALGRAGHEVTLVHPGARPMHRLLDDRAGTLVTALLGEAGVAVETGRRAVAVEPGKIVLDDGRLLAAGTLLLCTGSEPDTVLARTARLAVGRGIVVDDRLRTSDPHIHALGDCVEAPARHATLASAWDQADALARTLSGGDGRHEPAGQVVVRPRLPALAALGPLQALDDPGDDEQVVLSDPAGGRYGRLVLREGRVRAGVLVGLPRAVATVGRLHAEDRPAPPDRLALLLGNDEEYANSAELPDTAVVCQCNNVTKKDLHEACRQGARDLPAIAAATRATTGCGSCTALVRRICESAAAS
ncbi:FAD-dependent oxidoreductase [Streptomyces bacillaris]|uniref:FAD-dependent oxidoreductase n=1 Tax=Streptomyces cavourensis TaxID=67258 RepID=A0ABY5F803_9ACTN|nr:FAD-dependent oxidoreductase [Streptomyces cavourensis]ATY99640.1 NAD(P)/FAD-dependent oxidoreductase [Streptomyces cavourensis]TQO34558.1 assimilatory nitrate reductase electron transfer subunit [Streptomyces cavourensis]UTR79848.1 FAD-dependent oxidoreductase [Streptomyces cavourensis]GGU72130.1 FAD/NAD(P)-binding oxidoreductase [Streptomyces cavourensis]